MSNTSSSESKLKAFSQEHESKFYVVATPIGNMGDITLRAIEVLKSVDVIYCEDTRVSSKLLSNLGIKTKLAIYNDHSSAEEREKILWALQSGKSCALISDAGTPLISDPGFKLVEYLREREVGVVPIPGASAVISALSVSGLPTDTFYFAGFLPHTLGKLTSLLEELKSLKSTLVFYESPNRLIKSLKAIKETFGNVDICVARELTKIHEEITTSSVDSIIKHYEAKPVVKGEVVIMINNRLVVEMSDQEIMSQIKMLLKSMSLKDAVEAVSKNVSVSKKRVYSLGLEVVKTL